MTYSGIARRLRRVLWLGWPIGVLIWGAWIGSMIIGGGKRDALGNFVGADHLAFYTAARMILDGQPDRMYGFDDPAFQQYQGRILGEGWESQMAYRNPPFYALLYLPTAWLPFTVSMWTWTGIGLIGLGVGLVWLRSSRPARAFLWSLTCFSVFSVACFGQNTLLSFAVFAAVYRLLDDRRPFLAGLVAGLLWYKPQLLVGIFIWWGLMPRTHARSWLGLLVSGLVLAGVSWAVLPSASHEFVATLRNNASYASETIWLKHSPRAFWAMLLPLEEPMPANQNHPVILVLAAVTALAGVGVAAWLVRRTGGPLPVMFPVAVFLSLWASPHTLIYEWSLLIAAAVVLWERFPERRDAWLTLFALAWVALGVSTMLTQFQMEGIKVSTDNFQLQIGAGSRMALQLSVPVLGAVGWLTARELGKFRPADPRPALAEP